MKEKSYSAKVGNNEISIRSGKIAKQASGSVIVQQGETVVIVTVVASKRESANKSFLPLSVEYQEKIYAAGRIPGNYFRREIGRPSEKEILTDRLIDRPIRPLFPKGFFFETQVIATVLSADKVYDPDVLAMVGSSAALTISDIPFDGPIASVRVARVDGNLIANPSIEECENSDINIVVAGSRTGVIMVEGQSKIVAEKEMLEAIFHGHDAMQPLIDIQEQLAADVGKEKRVIVAPEVDPALVTLVESEVGEKIKAGLQIADKMERNNELRNVKNDFLDNLDEEHQEKESDISSVFNSVQKTISRDLILKEGKRIDGRKFDEIRNITCETSLLPRTHGSALFTRGETQVLGVLTLGTDFDDQRIETLNGDTTRDFMLHYNFPPFSVGECRRAGGPSRRDIGHGELALRAIESVMPDKEEFNYSIRLVSEVMESNGSSSMGTVCSGILALIDGGVPIKAPVSGIAMGLVQDEDNTVILSDILGDEDHTGDMDFKVAGTKEGITALQMDIKIKELSRKIMEDALEQARAGRLHILDKMLETCANITNEVSPYAPKILVITINKDKIRDIIGPGGKMIRSIQTDTNTRLEVNDDGIVKISAESSEDAQKAYDIVKDIGTDPEVGAIFDGKVAKTTDFGAFVTIKPGVDGLVHISELATKRVRKVTDVVNEGDTIKVKVLDVSRDGRIRLSHKATLEE